MEIAEEARESLTEYVRLRHDRLAAGLGELSYRERRIVEMRFGIGGSPIRTLEQIGRTFNVTKERIRQVENAALRKLGRAMESDAEGAASAS